MKFLVDTHVLVWSILSSKKVSKRARSILLDPDTEKFVSIITLWEISLKYSLGKLDLQGILPDELSDKAKEIGFEVLDLKPEIVSSFYKLPQKGHKDPFDRMLVWQAICGDYTFLTHDKELFDYKSSGLKVLS